MHHVDGTEHRRLLFRGVRGLPEWFAAEDGAQVLAVAVDRGLSYLGLDHELAIRDQLDVDAPQLAADNETFKGPGERDADSVEPCGVADLPSDQRAYLREPSQRFCLGVTHLPPPFDLAVLVGAMASTGRVIFAAGAVVVAVFVTFALSGPLPPKEMGVILGVAVLFDAALVRLLLLPVMLRLLGRWAWYVPKPLDRLLPEVRFGHA